MKHSESHRDRARHFQRLVSIFVLASGGLFAQALPKQLAPSDDFIANRTVYRDPHIGRFHKELAGNFGEFFSPGSLGPLLVGGITTGAAILPEQDVETFFLRTRRFHRAANPGHFMGQDFILGPAFGAMLLGSRATDNRKFRNFSYSLAQGYAMNNLIVRPAKSFAGRQRPSGENYQSFPSLHAAHSFMWATVVARHYGKKAAIPAFLAASYVSATRLAHNKHHMTDVFAGATLGYLVARTVNRRMQGRKSSRINWGVMPVARGIGLSVGIKLKK